MEKIRKITKIIIFCLIVGTSCGMLVYSFWPEDVPDPVITYIQTSSDSSDSSDSVSSSDTSSSSSSSHTGSSRNSSEQSVSESSSADDSEVTSVVFPLNINTAAEEDLMQLDGITERIAHLIVDYREKAGGYQSVNDLLYIPGIDMNLFNQIKDNIYCE